MKCQHIDTGGGYYQQPCDRDATHEVTYSLRTYPTGRNVSTVHLCRHHAPWKLAKREPDYCQIAPIQVPQSQE
ncbi:MAG: hypothetical protein ACKVP0_00320 [Pirellulaceae bacterium]